MTSAPNVRHAACSDLVVRVELEHYVVVIDRSCRLCIARRTGTAFGRGEDIASCFDAMEQAMADVPRRTYNLLVDTRAAPGRNDPAFEALIAEHRGKLLEGFARNAAIASTAAGRLQIQRYAKADGRAVFASADPLAAFAYLGVGVHPL
jgi:hypothetical protein